ncbi:MAG: hypothetical protein J3R72DRAFT_440491 [Linnemannia gamsii]|nr:MAG: hypothetical protein J3R72DRAFT_440491 [Linnemannia gamsii]
MPQCPWSKWFKLELALPGRKGLKRSQAMGPQKRRKRTKRHTQTASLVVVQILSKKEKLYFFFCTTHFMDRGSRNPYLFLSLSRTTFHSGRQLSSHPRSISMLQRLDDSSMAIPLLEILASMPLLIILFSSHTNLGNNCLLLTVNQESNKH